jgi:hypothetical protein
VLSWRNSDNQSHFPNYRLGSESTF